MSVISGGERSIAAGGDVNQSNPHQRATHNRVLSWANTCASPDAYIPPLAPFFRTASGSNRFTRPRSG